MDASMAAALERTTLRKVYLRLVPFCFLLYILCYVDRINVSFAALTMNQDLGLSPYVYGLATAGMLAAAVLHESLWVLVAFSVATIGFYGMKSPFWPLPSTFLTGSALAAGLALINSLGNFAGYLGPIAVGWAKDATGTFEAGLYVLAAAAFVSTITAMGCALWMPRGAVSINQLAPAGR